MAFMDDQLEPNAQSQQQKPHSPMSKEKSVLHNNTSDYQFILQLFDSDFAPYSDVLLIPWQHNDNEYDIILKRNKYTFSWC